MLKSAYVRTMHLAARPLRSSGVLARLERSRRGSFGFWVASQFAVYDAAALSRIDAPWWSFAAIDAVERWIAARDGRVRVFEYGSGASTVWLARRCAEVVSVEHDAAFAASIAPLLAVGNVEVRLVPPRTGVDDPHTPSGRKGYERCDFSDYVAAIEGLGDFDLVIVDGRARDACLEAAMTHLRPGGLVVFDNSNRRRYRRALGRIARVRRLRGWAPALPYRTETALVEPGTDAGGAR